MLEVKNIETCYEKIQVLWGISFQVKEGEIVLIIGANGAGKSTVLKTVSGNASGLAKCLDEIGWAEIVGTIAGDDTIVVITKNANDAKSIMERLKEIISSR